MASTPSPRPFRVRPETRRTAALLLSLLLSPAGLPAAPAAAAAPTAFLTEPLAAMAAAISNGIVQQQLPGAVLWIEHRGLGHHASYGQRAVAPQGEPMTADTVFDAASLTKVIATAPALMILVERDAVKLDDPVRTYVPEFTGEGRETITVRHLLTHVSGLRPGLGATPPWTGADTAIQRACAEKLQSPPGTAFRYSDINFILAGEIVRRAGGLGLDDFCARELFGPLGMVDTGFRPAAARHPRIAPTQLTDGRMLRGEVHDPTARRMGGVAGHAGLFTTAADLARFARMILNGGELDGVRVLRPATVALMTSVQSPTNVLARRGLGWDIDSGYSRPRGSVFPLGSFGHTGFTGTALWIDPFSRTFWILLSNRVHPDGSGNILPLQYTLGTLAAQAVRGFDFNQVEGALPQRTNYFARPATNAPAAAAPTNAAALFQPTPAHQALPGVLNGIDVLVKRNFAPLRRLRLGLITNHTGQDRWRNPTIDLLRAAPEVQLVALFSPEHGIRGELDAQVGDSVDAATGLPVYSLYPRIPRREKNQTEAEHNALALRLRGPSPERLQGLDALVFDIQDIGCRFYTYGATLGLGLEAAARARLKFFVLDRINPINGLAVEGPLREGDPSFVAFHRIPLRHGLTLGELARLDNAERGLQADLTVIPCEGWRRGQFHDETGLPWQNPSPNMRSVAAAILYPGLGLHESALSVGRGTDKPFEQFGAPYLDDLIVAAELNKARLPGVRFVPVRFTPAASTFSNQPCRGAALIITDRDKLNAVDLGLVIALTLHRLHPKEYALDKIAHLLRDPATLEAIRAGRSLASIKQDWESDLRQFKKRREPFLLYK
ncbi:MAG: hypothetical protein RJA22_488 [Verrucomicrobiota bacterium]|jgi:uncharacterized protein YbbC (DUF1343 family)/CubicO group peptidase (beta-lactamase class C family)